MKISIIMPVYNETNIELKQSIKSLLSQTYTHFELIIIDDNPKSTKIKSLLKKASDSDERIKILYNSKNLGPSESSNEGVKLANGKFIAKMDADDICVKNRLFSQLKFLINNDLDLICSNFYGFNQNFYNRDKDPYYGNLNVTDQHIIKIILSHSNIAMGPTLFFRRSTFLRIGGYRNILAEDYDLITRFIIYGYRVGYQSLPLIYKRNRQNNLSNNNSLNEFVVNYLIDKNIRKYNYKNILPINVINRIVNKISPHDIKIFNCFRINFNGFKKSKSLLCLFKAIYYTLFSSIVFKRNLWMLSSRIYNKKLSNRNDENVSK